MDVLFVNATEKLTLNQEVNGTLLLATKLLQAGISADVLRFGQISHYNQDYVAFLEEIVNRILAMEPRCVSFYSLWPDYHIMLRIARELKTRRPSLVTVLGGPQASATAAVTMVQMPFVDCICTDEGEMTVVPFFQAVLDGTAPADIPGVYYRNNGSLLHNEQLTALCDLNDLPHWDDRLLPANLQTADKTLTSGRYFMPIDAGRGCPFHCSFCCTSHFWRRTYRLKSAQRIVEDISYYHEKYGITSFWFSHDAFTTSQELVSQVCDKILQAGLHIQWRCTARIDCITEELVLKMKQAGLVQIELGVETGSPRMQKIIHKNLNLQHVKQMVQFLLKQKIAVCLFFMYGFPEETEEDLGQTLNLLFDLLDLGVRHVSMSFCRFNPNTEITETHLERLVLDSGIKVLSRSIFGYQEELDVIRQNKAIFPFFYHLSTPVRENYQYLNLLVYLYQQLPRSLRHLRSLYGGDDLTFYQDFVRCNPECFRQDVRKIIEDLKYRPLELLNNVLRQLDRPCIPQLQALLTFDFDVQQVYRSREDAVLQKTYDFCFMDLQLKLPIEQYSVGKTELLIQKINGTSSMKILRVAYPSSAIG